MTYFLDVASQDQIPQIAEIWEAGWHEAHADIVPAELRRLRSTQSFLDRTGDNLTNTRVAHSADEVLGFCMVKDDELYQMYVSPQARGSGAAQALIADAEHRIRDAGHAVAWLACAVGNARAARFYEKTGWVNAGRQVVELDTSDGTFPLEVWRFEKPLDREAAG